MKNSGIEWIGNIPDNWGTLPLKRMIDKHYGGCWGEDAQNNQNDVLCIRIADFNFDNQTIKENAETMRNYTDAQIEKGLLQEGDLIVEKSGGGDKTPVGRVVIFDEKQFPQRAMFANFSECLRLKNAYSQRYIAYHLKSLYYSYDMHYYFHQTTGIQNLDMQEYLATVLCVPSVEQQKAVVEILDEKCGKIDELIANQQGQIDKLKEYKQSVITEAVTKGLDKTAPMKDSGIEWIGEIPESWGVKRVKDVFYIIGGCGFKDEFQGRFEGDYPFCKASDINGQDKFLDSAQNYVNQDIVDRQHYKVVPQYSVLMSKIGEAMKKNHRKINTVPCIVDNNCQALCKKSNDDIIYLYYLFSQIDMIWFDNGGTIPNISNTKLLNFFIPDISVELQKRIAYHLDKKCGKIDDLIAIKQEKIEKLQEYKKSLIYEYVTGKKEVV